MEHGRVKVEDGGVGEGVGDAHLHELVALSAGAHAYDSRLRTLERRAVERTHHHGARQTKVRPRNGQIVKSQRVARGGRQRPQPRRGVGDQDKVALLARHRDLDRQVLAFAGGPED